MAAGCSCASAASDARLVVFNRVPKCGSSSLQRIIWRQAKRQHFLFERARDYENHSIAVDEQRRLAAHASRLSQRRPVLYDRHMLFVDFARFGVPLPAYINLVREPVRMQVSAFHFWRDCICRTRAPFCSGAWQVVDTAPLCNLSMDEGAPAHP